MDIDIYSDASHIHQKNILGYAFVIVCQNNILKNSGTVYSYSEGSSGGELFSICKALQEINNKKLLPKYINIYCDNIGIRSKKEIIQDRYNLPNINFIYSQSRLSINDKHGFQKRCDYESRKKSRVIGEIKKYFHDYVSCIIPEKQDYRKTLENFYLKNGITPSTPRVLEGE